MSVRHRRSAVAALAALGLSAAICSAAHAGVGDLLVAPTRLVLNGGKGAEIILKNVGDASATYRVSAELRRMTASGRLETVTAPTPEEQKALDMFLYAPRKIVLPPGQPQSVRINARAPAGLPDGEYRVHMLFRAIPEPTAVDSKAPAEGLAFKLIPIYGVTIPVIVRFGNVEATAGLSNVSLKERDKKKYVSFDITRSGNRSLYGEVHLVAPNVKEPLAVMKGVALYTEIASRSLNMEVPAAALAAATAGPVSLRFYETTDAGSKLMAETSATLR